MQTHMYTFPMAIIVSTRNIFVSPNTFIVSAFFFRQFELQGVPLVEGLRHFLETFRLPGEAPVISRIMEHFADHWLVSGVTGLIPEWLVV